MAVGRPAVVPEVAVEAEPDTLNGFAKRYFQAKAPILAMKTIRNRDDDYRLRIAPTLGYLPLAEVKREVIEVWLADLVARAPSRRMVVQTVATLRAILAAAVEWDRLLVNPALRLRLPPAQTHAEHAVERVLTRGEYDQLLADGVRSTRVETILRAAGEGGLRRAEIIGLRWPDVDLVARRIEVRRQVVQTMGEKGSPMKLEQPTKGRKARRVAISTRFAERLADWYAESVVEQGRPADGYIWPGRGGQQPMNENSIGNALERACERAGLGSTIDGRFVPAVTPHGLRHTAASLMLLAGVPLLVVSRQLGHANPNITAAVYAHLLSDAHLDQAATVFEPSGDTSTVRETVREEIAPS